MIGDLFEGEVAILVVLYGLDLTAGIAEDEAEVIALELAAAFQLLDACEGDGGLLGCVGVGEGDLVGVFVGGVVFVLCLFVGQFLDIQAAHQVVFDHNRNLVNGLVVGHAGNAAVNLCDVVGVGAGLGVFDVLEIEACIIVVNGLQHILVCIQQLELELEIS